MQSELDYYKILEIEPDSSVDEIQSAYRKLAFRYHPDRNHLNQEAYNLIMQWINEAYAILSDPIKRKEYDITQGYTGIVPKFNKGSKVMVSSGSSPYRGHSGVVDKEPIKDTFRFWYIVKLESKSFTSAIRFAEEELEQISE